MLKFGIRKLLLAFIALSLLFSIAFVKIEYELKLTWHGFIEEGDIVDVFEYPPKHAYSKYGCSLSRICRDVPVHSILKVDDDDYRFAIKVSLFQSVAISRCDRALILHENFSDENELQVYH